MLETEFHFCLWHHLPWLKSAHRINLYRQYDQPVAAYSASAGQLKALGFGPKLIKQWQLFANDPLAHADVQDILAHRHLLHDITFLTIADSRYPELLAQIDKPPEALYVKGDASLLNAPTIAIVGSRRASKAGEQHAYSFAKDLANAGFIVVSGGALGIDAAAHLGAVQTGKTVAVMATGIDLCYPAQHHDLYDKVANNGAVITEFKPQTAPKAGHFPKRNRIIAGMSVATLVVEAALRSGSLITARLANEYNREVFAIPGAINDPRSKGCNALIKQGAKLTEDLADIVEEFPRAVPPQAVQSETMAPDEASILACIDFAYTPLELIADRSDRAVFELLPILIELETAGYINPEDGGYSRVPA